MKSFNRFSGTTTIKVCIQTGHIIRIDGVFARALSRVQVRYSSSAKKPHAEDLANASIINLRLDDSRTRKGRAIVPMNSMTRAALAEAEPAALTDHVIEYAGRPVRSIRKGFINAVQRSGIGHVRIHDLRQTAAVTMLGAGVPMELVSQILGHSNISVTYSIYGRYRHPT